MDIGYCDLVLLLPLVVLIISDLKHREINLLWLAVFAAGSIVLSLKSFSLDGMLRNVAFNTILLLYLNLCMVIYLRLRYKRWLNPYEEYIGWGDVGFFVSISPLFGLREYIILLIISCSSGFIVGLFLKYKHHKKAVTIPMVSVMGLVLCGYIFYKDFLL